MKVCIIQPAYSADYSNSDEYFKKKCELLDACDDSMDIIVHKCCSNSSFS